jgi:hypothetical protein
MTEEASTFPVRLGERDIVFREPLLGQLIMLRRFADRAKAQMETETDETKRSTITTDLIVRTLDVAESLVVDPKDVTYIETLMLEGKVDYDELTKVLMSENRPSKEPVKATRKTPRKAAPKLSTTVAAANRARSKR